jgi:NAD(P)-dependent dehydrogenase (short-subunit alcohol dehydrogenase family)
VSALDAKRVVVVTGGAAGIGAGIAEELGRQGTFVVTLDPMVTVDGSARLEITEQTTADRIVAAGGTARASNTSVTDEEGVRALFASLVDEFGSLDAVVNVAGISRMSDFAAGAEQDWAAVLSVHLDGYLNVLRAALPIMADAGHGRVVGVTSGSGWRPANTGAYGCAKRAVAALTWQIGRVAPSGVTVNALSPIAATRMVTSALARPADQQAGASSTGGLSLSLSSMPPPENLGPIGSYLASDDFSWCSGQVIFSSGTEVAPIEPPRLLEVVRSRDVTSLQHALDTVIPIAFLSAERDQGTGGATNPRFGPVYEEPAETRAPSSAVRSCAVVTDDAGWGRRWPRRWGGGR